MGKGNKLVDLIVNQDIFGHEIKVNYRNSDTFKTSLGALCTIATYTLIIINFVTLLTAFIDGSN